MAGWWWIAIVGYIIGLTTTSVAGRYVALFIMTPGFCGKWLSNYIIQLFISLYSAYPITFVWVPNAIPRPPAKRSAAIGLANGLGTFGLL